MAAQRPGLVRKVGTTLAIGAVAFAFARAWREVGTERDAEQEHPLATDAPAVALPPENA